MSPSDEARRLAHDQLERGVRGAEQADARGRINVFSVRALAGAAVLLGEPDLADRATALLHRAPDEVFFAGAVANFELPRVPPAALRLPRPMCELERDHPLLVAGELRAQVAKIGESEPHIGLCLEGRVDEARAAATSDRQLEEVGLTLAVLGEFEAARRLMNDPELPDFRRSNVMFVLVIELFRAGLTGDALSLTASPLAGNAGWDSVQLALGFTGRVPWVGYPYPDW